MSLEWGGIYILAQCPESTNKICAALTHSDCFLVSLLSFAAVVYNCTTDEIIGQTSWKKHALQDNFPLRHNFHRSTFERGKDNLYKSHVWIYNCQNPAQIFISTNTLRCSYIYFVLIQFIALLLSVLHLSSWVLSNTSGCIIKLNNWRKRNK